jgi:hypothetical protein
MDYHCMDKYPLIITNMFLQFNLKINEDKKIIIKLTFKRTNSTEKNKNLINYTHNLQ